MSRVNDIELMDLDELESELASLSNVMNHVCQPESLQIVKKNKDNKNGSISSEFIYQCQVCGERRKQAMKKERAIQLNNDKFPNDFNADLESNFLLKKQRVLSISNEIQSRNEPEDAKIFRWVISERNKVEKLLKVEFQDVLKEYQEKLNGSFQQVLNEFVKKTFPISPQSDLLNEVFCGKGIHPEDDLKLWFTIKFRVLGS